MSKHPESDLQMKIVELARMRGLLVTENFCVANTASKNACALWAHHKKMGAVPGTPDITITHKIDRVLWVEVKKESANPSSISQSQRDFARASDGRMHIIYVFSLEDFSSALDDFLAGADFLEPTICRKGKRQKLFKEQNK